MTKLVRTLGLLFLLACIAIASALLTMKYVIHSAGVTVPDLKGKTLAEAHRSAAALQLDLRVANHFYSTTIPAGRVLNQSPAPGTTARSGGHLSVTESLGQQTAQIPALTGKPDRVAIQQIQKQGLQLGSLAYLPTSAAPSGTVLAQSPRANAQGVSSPRVQLLIATPPEPDSATALVMPSLIGQTLSSVRTILAHAGLKLSLVKRISAGAHPTGSILSQKPLSGYRVQPGDTVTLTVAK